MGQERDLRKRERKEAIFTGNMMVTSSGSPLVPVLLLLLSLLGTALAQDGKVCSANNTKIEENTPPRFVVTTIYVAPGVTVTISGEHANLFEINGTELILKEPLDYEKVTVIPLLMTCLQNGVPAKNFPLILEVVNLNDESPVFAENVTWNVREDIKVNNSIGSLSATDADFDVIYYELVGTTPEGKDHFKLAAPSSPSIQVSKALDYDKFTHAQLILYARDTLDPSANVSHTATATIIVNIVDVDNKNPWFQPCTFIDANNKTCFSDGYKTTVTRAEKAVDALILKPGPLYAIDGDWGINEAITYRIISGNGDDIFAIDTVTGNITMNKPAEVVGVIFLQAMASQVNDAQRYAVTPVEIQVVEKNNHTPQFQSTNYAGTVPTYSEIGSLVMESRSPNKPLKIFAADADFPDQKNPTIVYTVQNSSEFTVSRDGFILTSAKLNASMTIVVLVAATDTTNGDNATALVSVEVTPVIGAETTTTAPTTVTTTTAIGTTTPPPGSSSSAQPPSPASGTTKNPTETTTRSSQTGSSATSITNRPPGPTTTSLSHTMTVTTTSISGTPGKPTTGNPLVTISHATPPVPSLGPTKPTASSLPPGSGTTKPGTGPTTSRTTRTTAPPSGTTNTALPGTGSTTGRTIKTTVPHSVTPPGSGTTTPSTPRTGSTTSTTIISTTTAPSGGSPGTATTTPSTPRTGTTTSTTTITTTTPSGGSPGTGITTPSTPRTGSTTSTTRTATNTTSSGGSPASGTTTPSTSKTGLITSITTITTMTHSGGVPGSGTTNSSTPETNYTPGGPVVNAALQYSALDMAAVGASLAAILLICFALLGFLVYKQYGYKFRKMSETDADSTSRGSGDSAEGNAQLIDNEYVDGTNPDVNEASYERGALNLGFNVLETTTDWSSINGSSAERPLADNHLPAIFPTTFTAADGPEGEGDSDNDKEVKSILTKERRANDEGYKSVWFKGDIEPDEVVMINEREGEDQEEEEEEEEEEDNDESDNGEDDQGSIGNIYNQAHTVAFNTNDVTGDTDQSINTIM